MCLPSAPIYSPALCLSLLVILVLGLWKVLWASDLTNHHHPAHFYIPASLILPPPCHGRVGISFSLCVDQPCPPSEYSAGYVPPAVKSFVTGVQSSKTGYQRKDINSGRVLSQRSGGCKALLGSLGVRAASMTASGAHCPPP